MSDRERTASLVSDLLSALDALLEEYGDLATVEIVQEILEDQLRSWQRVQIVLEDPV